MEVGHWSVCWQHEEEIVKMQTELRRISEQSYITGVNAVPRESKKGQILLIQKYSNLLSREWGGVMFCRLNYTISQVLYKVFREILEGSVHKKNRNVIKS